MTRVSEQLSTYIGSCADRELPPEVHQRARLHIVDTIAAIVSGSRLPAGRSITSFLPELAGRPTCSVLATPILTTPIDAALANGMCAHADETDDSHAPSLTHPGCAVVPAALAAAEVSGCNGEALVRAVVAGYDVGTRVAMALGGSRFADRYHLSSHAFGGAFGATAAACVLLPDLSISAIGHALSYTVQMAAGNRCWLRDPDHVQKAFVFGGMPASTGVRATLMAAAGFTGVADPFEGEPGLFAAFHEEAEPWRATAELGDTFEIMRTSIKKWSVGSPGQAALDALESIIRDEDVAVDNVAGITVTLPAQRAQVVDSAMPDVNLRHILALYLADGDVSFASLHDHQRQDDPAVRRIADRIQVEARPGAERHAQAEVTVVTTDGRRFERAPAAVRGQPGNPMSIEEVVHKARELISPILGNSNAESLIHCLLEPGSIADVRELRPYWRC
jgi:2-methylcitrate dehydratase PrpD